jgi:cytochrome b6-f complex iron-sulfur subunit
LISRKRFISIIGYLVVFLLSGLWLEISKRTRDLEPPTSLSFPLSGMEQGTNLMEGIIAYRERDSIRIFSARCSHLGCKINEVREGRLICPCHGSEFDTKTGKAIKGPALRPLKELNFEIRDDQVVVELSRS